LQKPSGAPALFLRCASDGFSLTKPNTSCTIELPASHAPMVFGFIGMPFGIIPDSKFGFTGMIPHGYGNAQRGKPGWTRKNQSALGEHQAAQATLTVRTKGFGTNQMSLSGHYC
jgi:hypothetical protein